LAIERERQSEENFTPFRVFLGKADHDHEIDLI
jgi:hypothetical protein